MGFTFVVNLLLLTQPVYMLQVYDRVLSSGSVDTLIYISIMAALALAFLAFSTRCATPSPAARRGDRGGGRQRGDDRLHERAPRGRRRHAAAARSPDRARFRRRALDLRLSRSALLAPLHRAFVFLHPALFFLTLFGAVVLAILAYCNQQASARPRPWRARTRWPRCCRPKHRAQCRKHPAPWA